MVIILKLKKEINKKVVYWVLGVGIFIPFFITLGIYDFKIAEIIKTNIYSQWNWFKYSFDVVGKTIIAIPIYLTLFVSILCFLNYYPISKSWGKTIFVIFHLIVILGLLSYSIDKSWFNNKFDEKILIEVFATSIMYLIIFTFILIINIIVFRKKLHKDNYFLFNMSRKTTHLVVFLFLSFVTVQFLKYFFGRPRPYQIFEKEDPFISFKYVFEVYFGASRGNSFPSGHTQSTLSLMGLLFYLNKKTKKQKNIYKIFYVGIIFVTILVAISRILILAHFATDTLFSIGLVLIYFYTTPLIIESFKKRFRKNG